ncbi:MAG TPA: tetratricopeptide repeat protein [Dysgonamonadaceae bacterium]|nr:tetratricopeptide repeat protein [Dysgonamonadaceae bacterium]
MKLRYFIFFILTALSINTGIMQARNAVDSVSTSDTTVVNADAVESKADLAYRDNNFAESIKLYESQITENKLTNQESPQLYYNLGNAYFRDNQIAKAIVNYERALLLDPGDSDIRHNLRFAKTKIEDKIDSTDTFFITQWIRSIQNLYNANSWATIGVVLFILFIVATGIYMISMRLIVRKTSFYSGIVLLSLVIIVNIFAFKQKNKIVNRSTGIVMSASVSIYTSPDAHSQELFRLHEGAKVFIKRKERNWLEIEIANGSVGWLQQKSIETI